MTKIRSNQYNDFAQVDQPVPNAVELGGIDSATLDLPDTGNKALFLDQVDNEVKTIDPNGVIETLGGGGGGGGGLGLEFIDETTAFPYTLIKDRGTRCDFSQVVGPTEIELILPEGTGTETFRCGITITSLPEDVTVKISTSNAQTILLPDGSTTEFIENINAATEFVIAWDQSQYNYGDDWAPNYANFTGNVPFDEITVDQITTNRITLNEITDGIAPIGTVIENTNNTSFPISSANTWETARQITISEGIWMINASACFLSGGTSTYNVNIALGSDSIDQFQQSIRLMQIASASTGPEGINNLCPIHTMQTVTVAKGQTASINIRLRCNVSGVVTMAGQGITGGLSDPDNTTLLLATKIAPAP